jgi:hypothetical protein
MTTEERILESLFDEEMGFHEIALHKTIGSGSFDEDEICIYGL